MVRSASPDRSPFSAAAARSETIWAEVLIAADRLTDALERHAFDPNQPRVPAGRPDGGEWIAGIGSGIARPASDGGRPRDRIRLADASTEIPPELRADLKRRIDAADQRLADAYTRASSGLEISHAETDRARLAIAEKALDRVGSTEWAYDVAKDNFPAGSNKCNLFVHDMLKAVETDPPMANGGVLYNWFGIGQAKYPLLAGQWGDATRDISEWTIVSGPLLPGDVVANKQDSEHASGHTAIYVGAEGVSGRTVGAGMTRVTHTGWPWRDLDRDLRPVVRRYRGGRRP